jgi:hypothetical protein
MHPPMYNLPPTYILPTYTIRNDDFLKGLS